jgi:FkbM family methyltransferase
MKKNNILNVNLNNVDTFSKLNLEFRNSKSKGVWLWPSEDEGCWRMLNKPSYIDTPKKIASLVKEKKLIIQAGGNCGFYIKQYAEDFQTVLTFEPDSRNFFCLSYNVPEKNVFKFQACLGNENKSLGLILGKSGDNLLNVGGFKPIENGIIPQITIDSLGLDPSVIQLDVEGFEPFVLLGARTTIERSKPLIVLEEIADRGENYGWPLEKIKELLDSMGYERFEQVSKLDVAYIHKNKRD